MKSKIEAEMNLLREKGYEVESAMHEGKQWYQIDFRKAVSSRYGSSDVAVSFGPYVLATPKEMEELFDGFYTPNELLELCLMRKADETSAQQITGS